MENQQQENQTCVTLGDLFDKNIDKLMSDDEFRSRIDQKVKQVNLKLKAKEYRKT